MVRSKPHRATGNPRGRPVSLPQDLDTKIYKLLKSRVDPTTGLIKPDWKGMARELGVSRSTIARQMVYVRQFGEIESVIVHPIPGKSNISRVYYRIKGFRGF